MIKTAVIGFGWVGKSMFKLFPESVVYDKPLGQGTIDQVNDCDIAFICVPTPCPDKDELDTSIVEEVIKWCLCPLIVIRSTVNPGFTARMAKKTHKHIVFQPEYLGETVGHPMLDPAARQFMIIGGDSEDRRTLIELYTGVYNANINIRQTSALEAEVIKLSENRAIMFKVAQCQELYDACQAAQVDYYTIRDAVYGDDPRFNLWFTFIYPERRGANSKCIPKDVYAWQAWALSSGFDPALTVAMLEDNEGLIDAERHNTK
jgi:UDPglucose 6-dehydrogenase